MTDRPLITIGITCFNAEKTVGRAIESALAQDWPNKEIIVVDDFSTDCSREIVSGYSDVRLIAHEKNTGPGGGRQTLLQNAKGEYLCFFDDDDVAFPERVKTQFERGRAFEKENPNALYACYAAGEKIYPNDYRVDIIPPGRFPSYPLGPDVAGRILFFKDVPEDWQMGAMPSCAMMARTETFKAVGGFDPNFRRVEDLDFAVRLALKGGYFIGTSEKLFHQFATTGGDKSHEKNLKAEQQLADKHKDYLKSEGVYLYARLWPALRFYHFQKNYPMFFWTLVRLCLRYPVRTIRHLIRTGPKRLRHEKKMEAKG